MKSQKNFKLQKLVDRVVSIVFAYNSNKWCVVLLLLFSIDQLTWIKTNKKYWKKLIYIYIKKKKLVFKFLYTYQLQYIYKTSCQNVYEKQNSHFCWIEESYQNKASLHCFSLNNSRRLSLLDSYLLCQHFERYELIDINLYPKFIDINSHRYFNIFHTFKTIVKKKTFLSFFCFADRLNYKKCKCTPITELSRNVHYMDVITRMLLICYTQTSVLSRKRRVARIASIIRWEDHSFVSRVLFWSQVPSQLHLSHPISYISAVSLNLVENFKFQCSEKIKLCLLFQ